MPKAQCQYHQFLTSKDNIHIRYGIYGHKTPTQHIIVFILGRGEWIEKYLALYDTLYTTLKKTILILDHAGQGGSGGLAAHIESYDDYVSQITQLLAESFSAHTYSIIGHSMGGLIGLYGTLKGELSPKKMVLSAPIIGLPQKPVPRIIARPIAQTAYKYGLSQIRTLVKSEISYSFAKNRLTNDKEKYKFCQNTPYLIPSPTLGWVYATFIATRFIHHDRPLSQLSCPTLIFCGGQEKVVCATSLSRWVKIARKLGRSTIELVHLPYAKHEIFFETEKTSSNAIERTIQFLKGSASTRKRSS